MRAALRALPMLAGAAKNGKAGFFAWKPETRAQHLLALFGVCNARLLWIFEKAGQNYDFWAEIHSKDRHTFAFLIRNEAQPAMPQSRKALNFDPSPAGLPSNRTSNAQNAWRRGRFRGRHGHWLSFVSNQVCF